MRGSAVTDQWESAWEWAYAEARKAAAIAPRWMDAEGFFNAAANAMAQARGSYRPGRMDFRGWSHQKVEWALRNEFRNQALRRAVLETVEMTGEERGIPDPFGIVAARLQADAGLIAARQCGPRFAVLAGVVAGGDSQRTAAKTLGISSSLACQMAARLARQARMVWGGD